MILKSLLKDIYLKPLSKKDEEIVVGTISCDSREPQPQGLFVALSGFKVTGEDFIKDAIAQGALIIAKKGAGRILNKYTIPENICLLDVENPKEFLQQIALRFLDHPSRKVRTIGVTGTNGKTTITYLLESILKASKQDSAVIGTINYRIAGKVYPSKNTTPGFLDNQSYLASLAASKIPYSVMEVSSHALEQGRVEGIEFVGAVFTNLTQDHLDYHKNMEDYFKAKAILFENLHAGAWAIINADDSYGQRLIKQSKGKIMTYAIDQPADIKAHNIEFLLEETRFKMSFPTGEIFIQTSFIGRHNVYNILAAAAAAFKENIDLEVIREGIEQLSCVPGRLERVNGGQNFFVFIDYAHTEDGLVNVLSSLKRVSSNRIILVFGCGGDRDKGKRPKMGAAACELADHSVITSDNPRSEDPTAIINEIKTGFKKSNYEVIVDRKAAIAHALKLANPSEIVLIAGKGHENYQIIKDRTIAFNEVEIVKEYLSGKF